MRSIERSPGTSNGCHRMWPQDLHSHGTKSEFTGVHGGKGTVDGSSVSKGVQQCDLQFLPNLRRTNRVRVEVNANHVVPIILQNRQNSSDVIHIRVGYE